MRQLGITFRRMQRARLLGRRGIKAVVAECFLLEHQPSLNSSNVISFSEPGSSWRRPCCIKKMIAASSALFRKLTVLAFDESAEERWQESRRMAADILDLGPAEETDLQGALMEASGKPF